MPLDVICDHLKLTKKSFVTNRNTPELYIYIYIYIYSIHCVKLLFKHLEAIFKHLLGIEFATDVIFLVLSSVSNDLIIYVFITGVGCEATYVGSTELNNVSYISAKVTCTINFSDKKTWMLRLNIWMISVLEGSKYLT